MRTDVNMHSRRINGKGMTAANEKKSLRFTHGEVGESQFSWSDGQCGIKDKPKIIRSERSRTVVPCLIEKSILCCNLKWFATQVRKLQQNRKTDSDFAVFTREQRIGQNFSDKFGAGSR